MIPYDDLVIALATWRARQGLPVAQLSGALTPPPAPPPPPVAVPRSNPPAPPRAGGFAAGEGNIATPPPLAPPPDTRDEAMDVEDGALIEEAHYENEGADFAMAFGGAPPPQEDESTSVGSAPGVGRDSFSGGSTEPEPPSGKHNRNEDW